MEWWLNLPSSSIALPFRNEDYYIWRTQVQTTGGQQLWLATARFDEGFELGLATFLPTHKIAPDIDNERDYVVASLQMASEVNRTVEIQFVSPEFRHNLADDPFLPTARR